MRSDSTASTEPRREDAAVRLRRYAGAPQQFFREVRGILIRQCLYESAGERQTRGTHTLVKTDVADVVEIQKAPSDFDPIAHAATPNRSSWQPALGRRTSSTAASRRPTQGNSVIDQWHLCTS